jgi:hypothetical protein
MSDIATNKEGDLVFSGRGLGVSSDVNRDRHLIISRLMTMKGEMRHQPFLGFPTYLIGKQVEPTTENTVETEGSKALYVDGTLIAANLHIRALTIATNRVVLIVRSNRKYQDLPEGESLVVTADFYTMDGMPITKLDGTEG